MAGDDLLSALGVDILRRILHFVPTKEAASTCVLSRRWGSLWRSSGAVNLAVRLDNDESRDDYDSFVRAADAPVTRLTVRLQADSGGAIYNFLHHPMESRRRGRMSSITVSTTPRDVVGDLLSHPAARRVEVLRVAAVVVMEDDTPSVPIREEGTGWIITGNYEVGTLPSQTLRVLDLTRCRALMPRAAMAAFPCLETLRLRRSTVRNDSVQALIDAAPRRLATVHLESVFFQGTDDTLRLSCPTTTELVLELCGDDVRGQCPIEIDAPMLRYFRYKGSQRPFSLSSPVPDMARVDLHFLQDHRYHLHDQDDKDRTLELFWKFVWNFTSTRHLKLKVNYLVDIAVVRETELLCTFPNAVHVELDGVHHRSTKAASLAIANLLHCCPVVGDLRLKLRTHQSDSTQAQPFLEMKDRLDYDRSVNLFKRHPRLNPMSFHDDSGTAYDEVPGISGLNGQSFTCLQTSLTGVSLQFRMDNSRCLGARLVKFFTDNALGLKEIYVDSGNWKLCEHMNLNVERWIAPTSSEARLKRKHLTESSWEFSKFARNSRNSRTELRGLATSFTVLPLQR